MKYEGILETFHSCKISKLFTPLADIIVAYPKSFPTLRKPWFYMEITHWPFNWGDNVLMPSSESWSWLISADPSYPCHCRFLAIGLRVSMWLNSEKERWQWWDVSEHLRRAPRLLRKSPKKCWSLFFLWIFVDSGFRVQKSLGPTVWRWSKQGWNTEPGKL